MDIKWRIEPKELVDPIERERIETTLNLLHWKSAKAIDSYEMSPNGPVLRSIFLINDSYLCEVRMSGRDLEFDLTPIDYLFNYRVTFGEHLTQIEPPNQGNDPTATEGTQPQTPVTVRTKYVTVSLRHTDTLSTIISYFGDDYDEWLRYVLDAYPVSMM